MADVVFPAPPPPLRPRPVAVERIVRIEPLAAIRQTLAVSIHDVINRRRCKTAVADLYRIARRIENERWLRRELMARDHERWVEAHL